MYFESQKSVQFSAKAWGSEKVRPMSASELDGAPKSYVEI